MEKDLGVGDKENVIGNKKEVRAERVQSVGDKKHMVLGEINDAFMEELKTSLILKTVNDEDVESVEM